jgi:hypothetical protein
LLDGGTIWQGLATESVWAHTRRSTTSGHAVVSGQRTGLEPALVDGYIDGMWFKGVVFHCPDVVDVA